MLLTISDAIPFKPMVRILLVLLALLLMGGCSMLPGAMPKHDPAFAPVQPQALIPSQRPTGSIYQAGYDVRLFENLVARKVGDILTIKLVERMDAKKDADMEINKKNSTAISIPTILGKENRKILGYELESSLDSKHDFNGEGQSNQSNSVRGSITVTVVEVLPNGNLKVRGEKRVTLNQGHEYIRLSGIVRPVDIDEFNAVESTQIADATIMYTGEGAMADASRMGWLARFFNSILFPF